MVNQNGLLLRQEAIRQGGPLSPFLFLLCTESLHELIQQAASSGEITGFALYRRGPKLTHLFFVDDSLLFYRATSRECNKVMERLSEYESVSSQKVNRDKTNSFLADQLMKP